MNPFNRITMLPRNTTPYKNDSVIARQIAALQQRAATSERRSRYGSTVVDVTAFATVETPALLLK